MSRSTRKLALFFLSYLSFLQPLMAQNRSAKLEINPYYRYDNFPQISYRIYQRARMDTLQMSGNSYGINLNYVVPAFKTSIFKFGLGYYRYSFTKINKSDLAIIYGRRRNSREINYPSPLFILYFTDRYWYNTVNINLSFEKNVVLNKTVNLQAGMGIANYITFSQNYHIMYGDRNYRTSKFGYFGFTGAINASILKRFNRVQVGPSLIVPVVDMWKKDTMVPESDQGNFRWKYFNGIGIGLMLSYSIQK